MAAYNNIIKSIKNGNVLYPLFKETKKCMLMVYFIRFSFLNQINVCCLKLNPF